MIFFYDNMSSKADNFKYDAFYKYERTIMLNWEDMDAIFRMSAEELITRYTMYLGHINDEIKEAIDAFDLVYECDDEKDEFYKELIDIAMYTASAANLFIIKYEGLTGVGVPRVECVPTETTKQYFLPENIDMKKDIESIFDKLIVTNIRCYSAIRELFPQRKWHKKHIDFINMQEWKTVLTQAYMYSSIAIYNVIQYLKRLTSYRGSYTHINALIAEKQLKILSDAKLTGNHSKDDEIQLMIAKLKKDIENDT